MKSSLREPGTKHGQLTIISLNKSDRYGHKYWNCVCDCGNTTVTYDNNLKIGKAKSCGCLKAELSPRGADHFSWRGHGEISLSYWSRIRDAASGRRGSRGPVSMSLTIEEAWGLFLSQGRKCALSGLEIYFSKGVDEYPTASLDRIDSGSGYDLGNVQWVHKDINRMKNVFTQDHFIEMCRRVADTHSDESSPR